MDDDWSILERFYAGDESAFAIIFNQYQLKLINLAYRILRDRTRAEDIAQDVFVKVYEKKVKRDPLARLSTWLYRVTVNASLDDLRWRKFLTPFFKSFGQENPDASGDGLLVEPRDFKTANPREALEAGEIKHDVQHAIEALPEKLRIPLELYQFEDLPYAEIAAILHISPKAVERRLFHAREILRKKLGGYLALDR